MDWGRHLRALKLFGLVALMILGGAVAAALFAYAFMFTAETFGLWGCMALILLIILGWVYVGLYIISGLDVINPKGGPWRTKNMSSQENKDGLG